MRAVHRAMATAVVCLLVSLTQLSPAGERAQSNLGWWCPYQDICQMNCESYCGVGLGRCTPACFCECW